MGSNPARVACEVFFHRHSESTEYTVRRCKGKIKSKIPCYSLQKCIHISMVLKKIVEHFKMTGMIKERSNMSAAAEAPKCYTAFKEEL